MKPGGEADSEQQPLRGEQLGGLYFQAKTSEEVFNDETKLLEKQKSRRPRQPRLRIALFGSLLVGLTTFFIVLVPSLWATGSLPSISFTALVWLLLCYGFVRWRGYVLDVFYAYESASMPFWIAYSVLSVVLAAVWLNGLQGAASDGWLVALATVHCVASYAVLRAVLRIR